MERLAYVKQESEQLTARTLAECLTAQASNTPNREAYVFRGPDEQRTSITFGDLTSRAKTIGRGLIGLQLERGERIGLLGPNCVEWIESYYGAVFAGLVVLRLKTEMLEFDDELKELLNKYQVAALIVHPGDNGNLISKLNTILPWMQSDGVKGHGTKCPTLKYIVSMCAGQLYPYVDSLASDQRTDPDSLLLRMNAIEVSDMLEVWFTSGSSGKAKAAAFSNQATVNFLTSVGALYPPLCVHWNDRSFTWQGSVSCLPAINGGTIVNSPTDGSGEEIVRVLMEEGATCAMCPQYILCDLIRYYEQHPHLARQLQGLARVVTAGERITEEFVRQCSAFLQQLTIVYASTECALIAHSPLAVSGAAVSPLALFPSKTYEVKIVNGKGQVVQCGVVGEILVRAPEAFMGYLNDEAQTTQVKDASGWFRTGDAGRISDDSYLFVDGRFSNIISRATLKIHPASVENIVIQHPEVTRVCVFGISHPRLFEEICACALITPSSVTTPEAINEFCRQRCALSPKGVGNVPDHVICFNEFPLNTNGKVDTAALRKEAMRHLGIDG